MKRESNIFRILVVLLAVVLSGLILLAWFTRKPSYIWEPNFNVNSDQPYGLFIAKQLMEKSGFNIKESLKGPGKDEIPENATYLFIGGSNYISPDNWEKLVTHVRNGGQAVIAGNDVPAQLKDLFNEADGSYISPMSAYVLSTDQKKVCASLNTAKFGEASEACYEYKRKNTALDYSWSYVENELFYIENFSRLGYLEDNDKVNYFSYDYGKGQFIFHLNPLFFTNYHLLEDTKRRYFQNFLKPFRNREIYWDIYSTQPRSSGPKEFTKSPLSFIIGNYYLRNAWYLFLLGVLLFFAFAIKRVQRPIPVLPVRKNSTLEFLKVLAQLFFRDNNNKAISSYLSRSFVMFVRKRYNINLDAKDSQHVTQLHTISGVEIQVIDSLLFFINFSKEEGAYVSQKQLLDLNKTLNYFYKNCL